MLTSLGFDLYNVRDHISTYLKALAYCSAVTPHSFKLFGCVISDGSVMVTKLESISSTGFLLYFTWVLSMLSSVQIMLQPLS